MTDSNAAVAQILHGLGQHFQVPESLRPACYTCTKRTTRRMGAEIHLCGACLARWGGPTPPVAPKVFDYSRLPDVPPLALTDLWGTL